MANKPKRNESEVLGFIGVGLDNKDEHQRVTRNDNFLLVGGSEETHEHRQDVSIKFNESLKQRGKRLPEASTEEAVELLRKALED
ncbi:MAG: hypothetical protein L0Z62_43480 [Gemmataceae bacterium]|nr:hypothetical protein [Gemmataceae bacterium]